MAVVSETRWNSGSPLVLENTGVRIINALKMANILITQSVLDPWFPRPEVSLVIIMIWTTGAARTYTCKGLFSFMRSKASKSSFLNERNRYIDLISVLSMYVTL